MTEISNARICDVEIRLDRGIFLCLWLTINYAEGAGGTQGYGGIVYAHKPDKEHLDKKLRVRDPMMASALVKIMEVFDIEDLSDLKGMVVRVKYRGGLGDRKILAIGNALKDKWFSAHEDVELYLNDSYYENCRFELRGDDPVASTVNIVDKEGGVRAFCTATNKNDAEKLVTILNEFAFRGRPKPPEEDDLEPREGLY